MKRALIALFKFLLTIFFWFISITIAISMLRLPFAFGNGTLAWSCLAGFVGGCFFFSAFRFLPLYVFGHELTHWAVATLFLKKTSNLTFHRTSGFVRVESCNIWITLAPYFVPFYLLLLLGGYGIALLFIHEPPQWLSLAIAVLIGVTYAYHIVMTAVALSYGQNDLKQYGPVFSFALIILCNVFFLWLGFLMTTRQWHAGFSMFCNQFQLNIHGILQAVRAFRN